MTVALDVNATPLGVIRRQFGFTDDFLSDLDTNIWTTTATDSGTITVGDAVGGTAVIAPSDGTVADNDEVYLHTANEIFKFAADKPLYGFAQVQFTEANTDDANLIIGFMSGVAADSIQNDGAGPAASYSGALFYKVDGETVWNCENSIAGTQKTTATTTTAGGSSAAFFEIEARPKTSSVMDVIFKINGQVVAKHTDQSMTSATEMKFVIGAKNGSANNESIVVDFAGAYQVR